MLGLLDVFEEVREVDDPGRVGLGKLHAAMVDVFADGQHEIADFRFQIADSWQISCALNRQSEIQSAI
jgi:hypothetical protein